MPINQHAADTQFIEKLITALASIKTSDASLQKRISVVANQIKEISTQPVGNENTRDRSKLIAKTIEVAFLDELNRFTKSAFFFSKPKNTDDFTRAINKNPQKFATPLLYALTLQSLFNVNPELKTQSRLQQTLYAIKTPDNYEHSQLFPIAETFANNPKVIELLREPTLGARVISLQDLYNIAQGQRVIDVEFAKSAWPFLAAKGSDGFLFKDEEIETFINAIGNTPQLARTLDVLTNTAYQNRHFMESAVQPFDTNPNPAENKIVAIEKIQIKQTLQNIADSINEIKSVATIGGEFMLQTPNIYR